MSEELRPYILEASNGPTGVTIESLASVLQTTCPDVLYVDKGVLYSTTLEGLEEWRDGEYVLIESVMTPHPSWLVQERSTGWNYWFFRQDVVSKIVVCKDGEHEFDLKPNDDKISGDFPLVMLIEH